MLMIVSFMRNRMQCLKEKHICVLSMSVQAMALCTVLFGGNGAGPTVLVPTMWQNSIIGHELGSFCIDVCNYVVVFEQQLPQDVREAGLQCLQIQFRRVFVFV